MRSEDVQYVIKIRTRELVGSDFSFFLFLHFLLPIFWKNYRKVHMVTVCSFYMVQIPLSDPPSHARPPSRTA